ncbi:MAG TPA: hypothetical protein VE621_11575 [Bryobacteraceae bacterium]|nr:hypothetical protein [Bryobacteraceae bacterium]
MQGEIWNATDEQLQSAQAKLTYLGEQEKPIPTIVFAVEGHTPVMVRFLNVQSSKRPYDNDELPYTKTFHVSLAELRRILNSIRPLLVDQSRRPDYLSFTIIAGAGDAMLGGEYAISRDQGRPLLSAISEGLSPENKEGRQIIQAQIRNLYP